ncbi:MAG: diguanylate cyclase [Acidimicrobiales bacterium]
MSRQFRVRFIAALLAMQAVTVLTIIIGGALITRPALVDQMSQLMDLQATSAANQASERLEAQGMVAEQAAGLMTIGTLGFDDDVAIEQLFRTNVMLDDGTYAMFLGRADGSLVYVDRDDTDHPDAQTRTWIIEIDAAGTRTESYTWRDRAGAVVATATEPATTFDPRQRVWYADAAAAEASVWTDPYVFVTTEEPGVTAATPVLRDGAVAGVVGLDLGLSELSQVVGAIDVSENGRAILLTDDGTLVAHPLPEKVITSSGSDVRNARIGELDDPVTQGGYEALRQAGELETSTTSSTSTSTSSTSTSTSSTVAAEEASADDAADEAGDQPSAEEISEVFEVDGETYQVVVAPLSEPLGWFVAITAPQSDFVGEIVAAERKTALIAVAVGLAVVVLAMPLVRLVSRRLSRLAQRANVDALTGLVNRHVFGESLAREVRRSAGDERKPLCAAQIDVDYFKQVNDTYGHAVGDQALTVVAKRLAHGVRERDVVARLGGDEFAVLLVDTDEVEAAHVMERIRGAIEAEPVETADGTHVPITITVGLAQLPTGHELEALTAGNGATGDDGAGGSGDGAGAEADPNVVLGERLLDLADQGLYVAKEGGRNKVATRTGICSGGPDPVGKPR